jgi:hypothetical protein
MQSSACSCWVTDRVVKWTTNNAHKINPFFKVCGTHGGAFIVGDNRMCSAEAMQEWRDRGLFEAMYQHIYRRVEEKSETSGHLTGVLAGTWSRDIQI